jgi:hypothetical protein
MDLILGVPLRNWLEAVGFGAIAILVWYFWSRKKITKSIKAEQYSFHRAVRDPLDNSMLFAENESILIQTPSGKVIPIHVNRRNAEIVRRHGLGAFPNLRHNLEQYGQRHRDHYRRYFQPEYYYVLGGGFDFDPIMWWIYFDLFFGYDYDSPAYAYDSQVWPDMTEEYQEKLDSLPEQDDPAGLGPYLMSGAAQENPASFRQELPSDHEIVREPETPERRQEDDPAGLGSYLSRETDPAPQMESPREEGAHYVREEDPVGVGAYVSRDAAEVKTHEVPEAVSVEREEPASASETHETETVTETVEVDTSPSE